MISCTDFIPAYSELFKYLEKRQGKQGVLDYWNYISDTYVQDKLGGLAREKGIEGCWDYWCRALNEEAADFVMVWDDEAKTLLDDMRYCPSKGRLLEMKHIEPYDDYCGHCDVLYRRVLEPLGFKCEMDLSQTDKAKCTSLITQLY